MGNWYLSALAVSFAAASSVGASQVPVPFLPVETTTATVPADQRPATVAQRQQQEGCIPNFFSCASEGASFNGACCQNGQSCALDVMGQPACCPAGAVCTGTAPASFVTPSPTQPVSYVPNAYFSYPYAFTSFAHAGQCSQAVSQCSVNYDACTWHMGGGGQAGGGGVTIVVGGNSETVVGGVGATFAPASASSICSSLASEACSGLQFSMCTMTGTVDGFYFAGGIPNAAARPTPAPEGGRARVMATAGVVGLVAMNLL